MKEKMLKILAALLALCLIAAAVTACKGQTDKETTKAPEQTAEDTAAPEDDTTGAEDDTTEAPVDGTTSPEEQSTVPEYDDETFYEKIMVQLNEINKGLPSFKHITALEIRENEFEKTTTKKIKRFLLK